MFISCSDIHMDGNYGYRIHANLLLLIMTWFGVSRDF